MSDWLEYMDSNFPIVYKQSSLTKDSLVFFLDKISEEYTPPLRTVVCLSDYAEKILQNGVIFEAWEGNNLIGIVAGYFNDIQNSFAFITLVYVIPERRKNNIGVHLMNNAISFAKERHLNNMHLSVKVDNSRAQTFYKKLGFYIIGQSVDSYNMRKELFV